MAAVRVQDLIERTREGRPLTASEMYALVLGFSAGDIPEYQMAAWLMAVCLKGLTHDETVWMTEAMVRSGRTLDLSAISGVKVDKHSTGGVGDTTTIVLAPLVASLGVPVAKMSGRGLGFSGGTLDKLEAIPGFRVDLAADAFVSQVQRVGCAVISQSADIVPADKRTYALRDATSTVASVPLIVGSVISKKVAGGADAVVLDVKVGSGAFMKSEESARRLAEELVSVGRALGLRVQALLTDMDQPLGNAIGNAIEIREAIEVLKGAGSPRLREAVLELGSRMLVVAEHSETLSGARDALESAISSGAGIEKFTQWVRVQGGNGNIVDDPAILPRAPRSRVVKAPASGFVSAMDAEQLGKAAVLLGAGRTRLGDAIDPAAGIQLLRSVGAEVDEGDPLAMLYASEDSALDDAEKRVLGCVRIAEEAPAPSPVVLGEA